MIEPPCLFAVEAKPDQPCWGEVDAWDDTPEGDVLYACEGHYGWALNRSYEWNRAHYTPMGKADLVLVKLSKGVNWKCMQGHCLIPSKCMLTGRCLNKREKVNE